MVYKVIGYILFGSMWLFLLWTVYDSYKDGKLVELLEAYAVQWGVVIAGHYIDKYISKRRRAKRNKKLLEDLIEKENPAT